MFLGHLYPVFHHFAGGKGVSTAAGIVYALHWPLGLALMVIWLTMALGFRISSLAALTAAALMPLGGFYFFGNSLTAWALVAIARAAVLAAPGQHQTAHGRQGEADRSLARASRASWRGERGQFPARLDRESEIVGAARREAAARRPARSSRRCPCRYARSGKYTSPPLRLRLADKARAQRPVRADAARHDQRAQSGRIERRDGLGRQHIDDRGLEFARDVGLARIRQASPAAPRPPRGAPA